MNIRTDDPARRGLQPDQPLDPREVARFLRRNPSWLAAQPELWRALEPPRRVHGERLADHMAAMLAAERARAAAMTARAAAAAGLSARVHAAVLALIAASDILECVSQEWPGLLGVDAASVCTEGLVPGTRLLPQGRVQKVLGAAPTLVRPGPADPMLHGEAAELARVEALVAVPGEPPTLLALACRDGRALPMEGTAALAFLGRALATSFSRV